MSLENPFILGSKGQRSSRVGSSRSCECWRLLVVIVSKLDVDCFYGDKLSNKMSLFAAAVDIFRPRN